MAIESSRVIELEYQALKAEQAQRIGFRDNMIFVQLAAVGGVASWAATNLDKTSNAPYALLVIPWVCLVLGWTYLVNDHVVSRIGKYVRVVLCPRTGATLSTVQVDGKAVSEPFGWEPFHRIDKRRLSRKVVQFLIDQLTFVVPGYVAGIALMRLKHPPLWSWEMTILALGGVSLLALAVAIFKYADFGTS